MLLWPVQGVDALASLHWTGSLYESYPVSPAIELSATPHNGPIPLGVPPPPYPMLLPPVVAPAAPAPVATRAAAPLVQANMVNIPAPTAQPVGDPLGPPQAPVVVAGVHQTLCHLHPQDLFKVEVL